MKCLRVLALACLGFSAAANAEPIWNWSSVDESITITDPAFTHIAFNITVRNEASSLEAFQVGSFDFFDGSIPNMGILKDVLGRPVLTFTNLPQSPIPLLPGFERTYTVAIAVPSALATIQDAIANGDHYVLDPTTFVFTTTGGFRSYGERAIRPFDIFFGARPIPEPASAALFAIGIAGLVVGRKWVRGAR